MFNPEAPGSLFLDPRLMAHAALRRRGEANFMLSGAAQMNHIYIYNLSQIDAVMVTP